jgi:hypothetical protein
MEWLSGSGYSLPKDGQLHFRYRVLVHADNPPPGELESLFHRWSQP